MDMHEGIGQFGPQHAGEEIALPEANHDDTQNEQAHCREEDVVGAQFISHRDHSSRFRSSVWFRGQFSVDVRPYEGSPSIAASLPEDSNERISKSLMERKEEIADLQA